MKNKTRNKMSLLMISIAMSACGGHQDFPDGIVVPVSLDDAETTAQTSPANPVPATHCKQFGGNFVAIGVGSLSLKQTGCETITYTQRCTTDAGFCGMMDIQNLSYTLPLNGTSVSQGGMQVSARIRGSSLMITESRGSKKVTRMATFSSHPCDSDNDVSGIQVDITTEQGSGGVSTSTSTCQPWKTSY